MRIRLASPPPQAVTAGEPLLIQVAVYLNGLDAGDVHVECVLGCDNELEDFVPSRYFPFTPAGPSGDGETLYQVDLCEPRPSYTAEGLEQYKIRVFPQHRLLGHRFETGCMLWL